MENESPEFLFDFQLQHGRVDGGLSNLVRGDPGASHPRHADFTIGIRKESKDTTSSNFVRRSARGVS